MIKVNFRDGRTASYDLESETDFKRWCEVSEDPKKSALITGIAIQMHGIMITLPKPEYRHHFSASLLRGKNGTPSPGEGISCHFVDSRINVVAYRSKLIRVDWKPTGIQRFDPHSVIDRGNRRT